MDTKRFTIEKSVELATKLQTALDLLREVDDAVFEVMGKEAANGQPDFVQFRYSLSTIGTIQQIYKQFHRRGQVLARHFNRLSESQERE